GNLDEYDRRLVVRLLVRDGTAGAVCGSSGAGGRHCRVLRIETAAPRRAARRFHSAVARRRRKHAVAKRGVLSDLLACRRGTSFAHGLRPQSHRRRISTARAGSAARNAGRREVDAAVRAPRSLPSETVRAWHALLSRTRLLAAGKVHNSGGRAGTSRA